MRYRLSDTYGAPQCKCDIKDFENWFELEEYLYKDEEECDGEFDPYCGYKEGSVNWRIANGYAFVVDGGYDD